MIKETKIFLLLGFFGCLLFFACAKGNGTAVEEEGVHTTTPSDTTAPVITIAAPVANQVFNSGNIININGNITDDYGLYQGYIKITNDASGAELIRQPYIIHGIKTYNFNFSYTPVVAAVSNYTVTVSFEDHGLNTTSKMVKVKINP